MNAGSNTDARGVKRGAAPNEGERGEKRNKTKKEWRVPRKNDKGGISAQAIQSGDSGIWATCTRGKEGKSVSELRELFCEYAEDLYKGSLSVMADSNAATTASMATNDNEDNVAAGTSNVAPEANPEEDDSDDDAGLSIEDAIKAEVKLMNQPQSTSHIGGGSSTVATASLFTNIRMNVPCLIFFRTRPPIEPVPFITRICEDLMPQQHPQYSSHIRTRPRHIQRLTPIQSTCFASADALAILSQSLLRRYFESTAAKTFAVRANTRNNNSLPRNTIFSTVASAVGNISPSAKVNLSDPQVLILVEVYQNIVGLGVLEGSGEGIAGGGAAYERLRRFNLQELWDSRAKQAPVSDSSGQADGRIRPCKGEENGSANDVEIDEVADASKPAALPQDHSSMDTS